MFITILQIRIAWYLRKVAIINKKKTRIPITTVSECLFALISVITYILIGFDIVNAKDGRSIVLLFISSLLFNTSYFLSCIKLVNLGDRVIPKAVRNELMKNKRGNQSIQESENLSSIRRDIILVILFGVTFLSLILTLIFTVIVGGIVYKGVHHEYV